jgi:hypothetical protein
MTRLVQAGNSFPVSIEGGTVTLDSVTSSDVGAGINAEPAVVSIRTVIAEADALTNGSVTPTVDKRGYAAIGFYIPANYTGATKVRAQVSYNGSTWFYPRQDSAYLEESLVTGVAVAVAFYDLFVYPFVRLVFLNGTDVQQSQTNLGVKYSLVV